MAMALTPVNIGCPLFKDPPEPVKKNALAETAKIFAYIPRFQVTLRQPLQFPAAIDFTDAVVRVVADEDGIAAFPSDAKQKQNNNILFSAKARGFAATNSPVG